MKRKIKILMIEQFCEMLDKYYQTPNTIISDGDLVLHAKQN
jgi:hypothetical protein